MAADSTELSTEHDFTEELNLLLDGYYTANEQEDEEYELVRRMILASVPPKTPLESLLVCDLIDLTYEILRLRRIKSSIRVVGRSQAVEELIFKVAASEAPEGAGKVLRMQARQEGKKWRNDIGEARAYIEANLRKQGFGEDAIIAEEFRQNREIEELLERRIANAQHRRSVMLRDIHLGREFARRARDVSDRVIEVVAKDVSNGNPK